MVTLSIARATDADAAGRGRRRRRSPARGLGRRRARRPRPLPRRSSSGPASAADDDTVASVRRLVVASPLPVVVDGDGLFALAWDADDAAHGCLRRRRGATVLTPHDGEYGLLTGARPGPDRIDAARRLAAATGSVVLLKGPTTVVAEPDGDVRVVTAGDARLATAGTGDVLAGIIGALLADRRCRRSTRPPSGAWIHGAAGPARPVRGAGRQRPRRRRSRRVARGAGVSDRRRRWAWAEIDLDAVAHNVGVLRAGGGAGRGLGRRQGRRLRPRRRVASAGPRSPPAPTGLCVALTAEGVALREAGIEAPILVLSEQPPDHAAALVAHDLTPDRRHGRRRSTRSPPSAPARARRPPQGRHRHAPRRRPPGRRRRPRRPHRRPRTVPAARGRVHPPRRRRRARRPVHRRTSCAASTTPWPRSDGRSRPVVHAANSAGALAHPAARRSFVRAGIAMYGISPGPDVDHLCRDLRPVMSLKARVSFVKRLAAGDRISYGLRHALRPRRDRRDRADRLRRRRPPVAVRRGQAGADRRPPPTDRRRRHDGPADGRLRRRRRRRRRRGRADRPPGRRARSAPRSGRRGSARSATRSCAGSAPRPGSPSRPSASTVAATTAAPVGRPLTSALAMSSPRLQLRAPSLPRHPCRRGGAGRRSPGRRRRAARR